MVGRTGGGDVGRWLWFHRVAIEIEGLAMLEEMQAHVMEAEGACNAAVHEIGVADGMAVDKQDVVGSEDFQGCIRIDHDPGVRRNVNADQEGIVGKGRQ